MEISKQDVEHVAILARLGLDEAEKEQLSRDLSQILTAFETLNGITVTPSSPPPPFPQQHTPFRGDAVRPSLPKARALMNASQTDADYFEVPIIII